MKQSFSACDIAYIPFNLLKDTKDMYKMKVLHGFLFFILLQSTSYGQLFTQRTNMIRFYHDSSAIGEVLGNTQYALELGRGFGSLGDEQAWNGKFIGSIDFYRWNSSGVIRGLFSQELSANPHNDIAFNPRAIIWEQALVVQLGNLSIGMQHRCKHDVDNSDSTHGDTPSLFSVRKRVLINSGLHLGWTGREVFSSVSLDYTVRSEAYFINSDYRFPENNSGRSYADIRGTFMSAARVEYSLANKHAVFARAWSSFMVFKANPQIKSGFEFNARFEGGYHLQGKQAGVDIFLSWERIFDETAFTVPAATQCVSIGIRASSSAFF